MNAAAHTLDARTDATQTDVSPNLATHTDVLIIGAGFAGMYALHRARQLGFTAQAVERAGDVGGTWYWNRYPGCRCDVESFHYSYSFDDELQQDWVWSEKYATQPEILSYARHVADRFDLRRSISFNTALENLTWHEAEGEWVARIRPLSAADTSVTEVRATWVIMASGALSVPKPFELPGQAEFAGEIIHTHEWPEGRTDFSGQCVAVIGTGSTGVQVIPEVAKTAESVVVLQRTPSYVIPAGNRPYTQAEQDDIRARYGEIREAAKRARGGVPLDVTGKSALDFAPEEREAHWQRAYDAGNPFQFNQMFTDLLVDTRVNRAARDFLERKIRERIGNDPDLAAKVIPSGYPFGTRRMCLDTGYYETLTRPSTELVDLRVEPLQGLTPYGVRVGDREIEIDVLIFATGFDALTGALLAADITGVDGEPLREHWADGPRTLLGVAMSGYPNLFTVTGPGSPSVLSNVVHSIEQHVEWITDLLASARDAGVTRVEATPAAEDEWQAQLARAADHTLFEFANSWYVGSNVPGKPRFVLPYLGGLVEYREHLDQLARHRYPGFTGFPAAEPPASPAGTATPAAAAPASPPPPAPSPRRRRPGLTATAGTA